MDSRVTLSKLAAVGRRGGGERERERDHMYKEFLNANNAIISSTLLPN